MRILSRKIWRAFPELDRFDDDVCRRYVRHARRAKNMVKGTALVMIALPIGIALWAVLMFNYDATVYYLSDQYNFNISYPVSDTVENLFMAIRITGYIWFPIFCMLLVRDRWLNRCVRMQLSGIKCGACGYSLIGLTLIEDGAGPAVICPECGHFILLRDMGLTRADIDPELLTQS